MSKLFKENKSGWETIDESKKNEIFKFADDYMDFLNKSKTEREIISSAETLARENGFKSLNEYSELHPGDKVYYVNRAKNIYLAVIGKNDIEDGINIIGAHADSPRLDLKPSPLFQKGDLTYFNTHYYGGIKKYQWTTIPLAIHGVIVKENGEKITVSIGENEDDPVFVITDLLPHLAKDQMQKKLTEAIEGEKLDLVIGNIPSNKCDENDNPKELNSQDLNSQENKLNLKVKDDNIEQKKCTEKIKENIMKILNEKYDITEEDFESSELEIVPAFKARTAGFDRSMVAAYGQDDKSCVYSSLRAMLSIENPERTAVCLFSDKEEIGSMGNTGMQSHVFDTFIAELLNKLRVNRPNLLDEVFCNSRMLSADVDAAMDPLYAEVSDITNAGFISHGVSVNKYTGARGKYDSSDANAEYVAYVRKIFNENNVKYQFSELGKVDQGGGGTIAYILANKGVDVIDCGIPVLSMHSPYELTSKFDIYSAFEAYKAFFNN